MASKLGQLAMIVLLDSKFWGPPSRLELCFKKPMLLKAWKPRLFYLFFPIRFPAHSSDPSFLHWLPHNWSSCNRVGSTSDNSTNCCLSNTLMVKARWLQLLRAGPRSVAWFLKFLSKIDNFPSVVFQSHYSLGERALDWHTQGPQFGSWPGRILCTYITFKDEMRQMEKNKINNNNN